MKVMKLKFSRKRKLLIPTFILGQIIDSLKINVTDKNMDEYLSHLS